MIIHSDFEIAKVMKLLRICCIFELKVKKIGDIHFLFDLVPKITNYTNWLDNQNKMP